MFGEQLQRTLGHNGLRNHVHVFNVVLPDDHVLTIDTPENHDLVVFVSEESVEDSTIDRYDHIVFKAFADLKARVDDADQHPLQIAAGERCEVGTDATAFVEQQVTATAVLHKQMFAGSWIAGTGGKDSVQTSNLSLHLSG